MFSSVNPRCMYASCVRQRLASGCLNSERCEGVPHALYGTAMCVLCLPSLHEAHTPGFRTQLRVTTSHSTGGGPTSCVHYPGGDFQVDYHLGLWLSGVVKDRIWLSSDLHLDVHLHRL